MTEPELYVDTVFGSGAQDVWILARSELGTRSSPKTASALLRLQGGVARFEKWMPWPVRSSWRSVNGTVYYLGEGRVFVESAAECREELVAEGKTLDVIWGIDSRSPLEDTVFALQKLPGALFIRRDGAWSEIALPADLDGLSSIAALTPTDAYISGSVILHWDGEGVHEVESPSELLYGIIARPNHDLYVSGDNGLYHWDEASARWGYASAPSGLTVGLAPFMGYVVLASVDGVLTWDGKAFATVVEAFPTNSLVCVGPTLFAVGANAGLRHTNDLEHWEAVALPQSILPREAR